MPLPAKVIRGKTIVLDTTVQLVDAISRHDILKSIVPAKILETAEFIQQEISVTSLQGTQISPVTSFLIIKSDQKFQWSIDGGTSWMTASFVSVIGQFAQVQIIGLSPVPSRVTLIVS